MTGARGSSCIVALLLLLSARSSARAQDGAVPTAALPEVVTLEEAIELLRTHSPVALAVTAQVDVARAERVSAGVHPNPSLSYDGLVLANGENTGAAWAHQVVLEQPALLFGQLRARRELAELGVALERRRAGVALTERALVVREAFIRLLARQQRVQVLEEGLVDLESIAAIVKGRSEAGDRSEYDVSRIELEVAALQVELQNARAEVAEASGGLAVALGFPGWQPRAEGALTPSRIVTSAARLWQTAQLERPSIQAARAEVAAATGAVTLARRDSLPVPTLAVGTMITQRADSQSVFFGVSLPLRVFDRGQGALARAHAQLEASHRQLELGVAETHAELLRARAVYLERREALRALEAAIASRVPSLRRMAEESYRGGGGDILELLDAFRSVRAIHLAHLEQREVVKIAEARLLTLAGEAAVTLADP